MTRVTVELQETRFTSKFFLSFNSLVFAFPAVPSGDTKEYI